MLPNDSISLQKFVCKLWYLWSNQTPIPEDLKKKNKKKLTSLARILQDQILCVTSLILDFSYFVIFCPEILSLSLLVLVMLHR